MYNVYSFADVSFVISHPSVGKFSFHGEGLGSISISRSNDMTQHDLAADGTVMISKINAPNGTMALALQQTSEAHAWMKKYVKYLKVAPTSEFASATAILVNHATGETTNFTGVSPQKNADAVFQQTGQQITWNLMAAEITD